MSKIKLNNVRLSFHSLAQAEEKFGGKPKFTATFIVDPSTDEGKDNLQRVKAAIRENEKEKLGGKELPLDKTFLSDGNDKGYTGWENMVIISSANTSRPVTVGKKRQPIAQGDDQWFYAGCRVNAIVSVWTMDHAQYGQRHICSLEAVQFHDNDTPFSSNVVNIEEDFDDVEEVSASVFDL